jgi:ribosomal-protein-alanine N-acetyltransferase
MTLVNLQSERLIVRDWRITEAEGRFRIFGDPKVRRFLSFGAASMEEAANELRRIVASQSINPPRPSYHLAVELVSTGKTIGNVGFEYRAGTASGNSDVAEIGYFFEPFSWGYGYAAEASILIIDYAFRLGAATVIAECDEENSASERVMQRCGMASLDPISPGRLLYGIKSNDRIPSE